MTWYRVTGLDAMCGEPEDRIEAETPEEAAEIYMHDRIRYQNDVLDEFRVGVQAQGETGVLILFLTGEVVWTARREP